MFSLKTKDKFNKFTTIFNLIYGLIIVSPILIASVFINAIYLIERKTKLIISWNIWILVVLSLTSIIAYVIKFLMNIKWRKLMFLEFYEIVKNAKLPTKKPKVLYVYTTKNDFMPSRLKQNILQTYKNIEVWISVGGPNDKNLELIKQFSQENNVNLYIMNRESKSKADNLNSFLEHYNKHFDYLLIGDADVAFANNFVETSLKLFNSDRFIRLGFVSSTVMNYRGNNVFTNAFCHLENEQFILKHQTRNYLMNLSPNLYSSCCLISKSMLEEMDNRFPNSNVEDWYSEKFANKNLWVGVINPLSVAMQKYDKNIWDHLNRMMRLYSWGIRYYKKEHFKNYNTKFDKQNQIEFRSVFLGFYFVIGFMFTSVLIWLFVINFRTLVFGNLNYWIIFATTISSLTIFLISNSIMTRNISPKDGIKRIILLPFYGVVLLITAFKTWFDALFLSKYKNFCKVNKNLTTFKLLLPYLFFTFITATVLSIGNFLFFKYLSPSENNLYMYLVIIFNMIFGLFFMYSSGIIILHFAGKIMVNKKFNEEDFIYCENKYVTQKKLINKVANYERKEENV